MKMIQKSQFYNFIFVFCKHKILNGEALPFSQFLGFLPYRSYPLLPVADFLGWKHRDRFSWIIIQPLPFLPLLF